MSSYDLYEILILFACIVFSAFYSGCEAALVSISIDRTRQLIEEGGRKGRALQFLATHANALLSTILIGNNLVNIFGASYSTSLAQKYLKNDALAISVGLTTLAILIFGEILPKTFCRNRAEKLAVPFIRILQVNFYLFYPAVAAITWLIHKILGRNAELSGRMVTIDDIEFMVSKAEKEKTMDSKQLDLLASILEFPTIKVKDIMVPRTKINFIHKNMGYNETKHLLRRTNHSRYPVCENDLEHTIGFLHVKDLVFMNSKERKNFEIAKYLKPPFFVYEHMKIQAVFDHMNRKKVHLGLVKDENGLVVGIVTLEDIMEEIFGEIHDEHDAMDVKELPPPQTRTEEGIFVDALISLRDLYNDFDIKIPLNDNYSTLNGFLLDMMGNNFPKKGMMAFWEGYSFRVERVENNEIKLVKINDVEGEKHLFSKKFAEKESSQGNQGSSSENSQGSFPQDKGQNN